MQNAQILVADYDRLALAKFASEMRDAGYSVLEANNGEEAIRLCAEHCPRLAVLDLCMPGNCCGEIAREVYVKHNVPFIIFSAYDEPQFVREVGEIGALSYLLKPLEVVQTIPSIEVALLRAAEINKLKETEYHLNRALNSGRETSTAIGIIMQHHGLSCEIAFEKLKRRARSQRRKLSEVSEEIVRAAEFLYLSED